MKKYIKQILFAAMMAPILTSCVDDVDINAYITEEKMDGIGVDNPAKVFDVTLAGMYRDLQEYDYKNLDHNYFGQKSFDYLTSLMGNDMIMTSRNALSTYHYVLDYGGQNFTPTDNRWREYYRVIYNANQILAIIPVNETDPTTLQYRAVALGFRGYAYWQLTNLYQLAYYVGVDDTHWGKGAKHDFSQELCVPIMTETNTGNQPRSTLEKVYQQMLGDLETSFQIFKDIDMVKSVKTTDFDGCVVATYLARAYMVKQNWAKAIEYSQIVIDNCLVMTTEAQITQGFSTLTLPNVVFGCDITSDNTTTYRSWFSQMDAYGAGYAVLAAYRAGFKPFVERIADDDIRLTWFCSARTGTITVDGEEVTRLRDTEKPALVDYQSVKFIGVGRESIKNGVTKGWQLGDYIYLRSEEAYLMKAEALAHTNELVDAKAVLNLFMKTRQPSYNCTLAAKADIIEEINFQKRVEYWGEGMEYLDNRRLNIVVDRTDATWGKENNNHLASGKLKVEQESLKFLYKIPITEIENNTKINPEDQNP